MSKRNKLYKRQYIFDGRFAYPKNSGKANQKENG